MIDRFPKIFFLCFAVACFNAIYADEAVVGDATELKPRPYYGTIAQRLGTMVTKLHVLKRPFDDEISRRAWTNLVTYYDYDHSVFLKEDLAKLAKFDRSIDDQIKKGDVSFGYTLRNLYCKRLSERLDFATNFLAKSEFDFTADENYMIKRKDALWPEDEAAANAHWRKRLKNEVLSSLISRELEAEGKTNKTAKASECAKLSAETTTPAGDSATNGVAAVAKEKAEEKSPLEQIRENLIKKYRQYAIAITAADEEAVLQAYMSAITRAYDPHTDYMSPTSKEDFDMEMNHTLCGVGAVLSMDDGALKINEIMAGGPMDVDGRIKEGDKIVGVKQGDGEMVDIMWQPMTKSIHKIRGKKGTRVTLEIIPRSDPTGTLRKQIELVRDEIKLDEQAATGHVERVVFNGVTNKVGYVYLPAFYGTMEKKPGDEGFLSCADDVARYVGEFNAQDVEALILDMRGNGGGSLKEAVMLSALFVHGGPVVIIKDNRMAQPLQIPPANPVAFTKPLIVMIDRASASASEIVAGHLRDVGRAIVVGDIRTHGKGTVQSVLEIGRQIGKDKTGQGWTTNEFGSVKITTARFYRINGKSTQVKGVESDIVLPSCLNHLDIGEDKLANALPYSTMTACRYSPIWDLEKYIPELKRNSTERVRHSERFAKHLKNVEYTKEIFERQEVPLEYSKRKALMKADKECNDNFNDEDEEDDEETPKKRKKKRDCENDLVLQETFNIAADLIKHVGNNEMPPPKFNWFDVLMGF